MNSKTDVKIISRHPAAIEFAVRYLHGGQADVEIVDSMAIAHEIDVDEETRARTRTGQVLGTHQVLNTAEVSDVRNEIVIGNLPMHLAKHAKRVGAIEFGQSPPRGQEYTAEDMRKAGARIRWYVVREYCPATYGGAYQD